MTEQQLLERVETQLRGERTTYVPIANAPREHNRLLELSTYQLKRLYENLIDQEYIAGSPLGEVWGAAPVASARRDKSYLAQWVREGLLASDAYFRERQYNR